MQIYEIIFIYTNLTTEEIDGLNYNNVGNTNGIAPIVSAFEDVHAVLDDHAPGDIPVHLPPKHLGDARAANADAVDLRAARHDVLTSNLYRL